MKTMAALVAGFVLGGTGVGLAASKGALSLYDMYPRDSASLHGLDLYCSYQPARAGGTPRLLICGRDSTNLRGMTVGITAVGIRVWDSRRPAGTSSRFSRTP